MVVRCTVSVVAPARAAVTEILMVRCSRPLTVIGLAIFPIVTWSAAGAVATSLTVTGWLRPLLIDTGTTPFWPPRVIRVEPTILTCRSCPVT